MFFIKITNVSRTGVMLKNLNYPSAFALHEQVMSRPELFMETLKSFHNAMGTKLMVPVIGKKELNLHLLYVEVTRRGGYDKVVAEKKWREISSVFNFSPTTTSASYVLKKHYHTLLYHYEQVYFFNSQSSSSFPPSGSPYLGQFNCGLDIADQEESTSNRATGISRIPDEVVGTIDWKFDWGYLVSVKLGTELLCGVIYHPDEPPASSVEDLSMAIVPYNPKRIRRRRKKRWGGDPTHPKATRSGYNFFFAEKHSLLKSLYPNGREREFTKMIGESWNNLSAEERLVYQDIGLRDKERYMRELKEYHERLASHKSKTDNL